jgi:hypothetical protein
MSLIDWSQVPTGVVTGLLVEAFRWGIEQAFQYEPKRRGRSKPQPSRVKVVLREVARFASTAIIVVLALTYAQSSAWRSPSAISRHLTPVERAVLTAFYLDHHPYTKLELSVTKSYHDDIQSMIQVENGVKTIRDDVYFRATDTLIRFALIDSVYSRDDQDNTNFGDITPLGETTFLYLRKHHLL